MYYGKVQLESRLFASVCKTIADANRDPELAPNGFPIEHFLVYDLDGTNQANELPERNMSLDQLGNLLGT